MNSQLNSAQAENSKIKVFVGMSGGVDSSVAAALLVEQGYDVTGVFMKNWSGDNYGIQADCPWEQDQADAMAVCEQLGIPFRTFNFEKEYRAKVVEYFFDEYRKGRTPNPDVMCNKEIKFDIFLKKAQEEGADMIATGHYARVQTLEPATSNQKPVSDGQPVFNLLKGVDENKDQSYFLYTLNQERLSKTMFPIGHLTKPDLRKKAKELGLKTADKPDSQGICFIGEINVYKFLRANIPTKHGEIRDVDNDEIVGEHDGVWFYTIGQREGLGIGGQATPYFVVDKDIENNVLYVGHGNDHPRMFRREVKLENLHLIDPSFNLDGQGLSAAARYRQKPQNGILDAENLTFTFNEPQRAITSGQSLVIYAGGKCVGGGIIA